jgi:outer membrane protein assembly factor BamE (lipoprotein component of BamABCDE complex)
LDPAISPADYGMKDGKVFDYVSRTTPTTGRELSYINNLFQAFTFKL